MEYYLLDTDVNHIGGLCIRPSNIDRSGLFTMNLLERHKPIGIWTGELVQEDEWRDDHYGCEISGTCVVSTPCINGNVDFLRHPFAAMNEPRLGETAQIVSIVQEYDCEDSITSHMILFYTTRYVEAGEELTWHYGPNYDRTYEVGQMGRIDGLEHRLNFNRLERMLKHRPDGVYSIASTFTSDDSQDPDYVPK
jgi:hypothetical protein